MAILRSKESGAALAIAKANTVPHGQTLELDVRLNLPPQVIFFSEPRLDDGELIYNYPLTLN